MYTVATTVTTKDQKKIKDSGFFATEQTAEAAAEQIRSALLVLRKFNIILGFTVRKYEGGFVE